MHHDFLDKYAGLDSPVHRLDPRAKIISALAALVIVTSEPRGEIIPFGLYYMTMAVIILLSRVPLNYYLKRMLVVAPFILAAVILLPVSLILTGQDIASDIDTAVFQPLSILLKAFWALLVLTVLTATERMHTLLAALRLMKSPAVFNVIVALTYRYIFILTDETLRTGRARESRLTGRPSGGLLALYGNQAALVFIRSWERSRLVYQAMLARGFEGNFPVYRKFSFTLKDCLIMIIFILLLLLIRGLV